MEYRICYPDELYHYGVKGMRWGVRHDPERSGNGRSNRKGMSTAKKVAIGVGVAAAVAGVAYVGIKTGKARQIKTGRAIARQIYTKHTRSGGHSLKRNNIRRGADSSNWVLRGYNRKTGEFQNSKVFYSSKDRPKLVGHSTRRSRYGAAQARYQISDRRLTQLGADVKSGKATSRDYDRQYDIVGSNIRRMQEAPTTYGMRKPAYKKRIRRLN